MTTPLLFSTAIALGLLAFFEPCTIATHTLFSQRLHKKMIQAPILNLLLFWVIRSLLMVILLLLATILLPPVSWTLISPAIPLLVIGGVYLLSRFVYLPIPHLEFYRLVPGWKKLPYAITLGLTLPACTIPLVMILIASAVTLDNPSATGVAGLLFGSAFSSITMLTAITGVNSQGTGFLSGAAKTTPYITAVLLLGTAACCFS
jgi:cytochrome c-type biogenesis protein